MRPIRFVFPQYIKFACLIALMMFLGGCNLEILVSPAGQVTTVSGNYDCPASAKCTSFVNDTLFNETFSALPAPGYQFAHWAHKGKGLCSGSSANCTLSTTGFDTVPWLMAILTSETTFYLEPVFEAVPGTGSASIVGHIKDGALLLVDNNGYIHDVEIVFNGTPDTDSDGDTVNDSYSFTFANLPADTDFRLYHVRQGGIAAVFGGVAAPTSNVFSLNAGLSVDLGNIRWSRYSDGVLLTETDIFSYAGVTQKTSNPVIPQRINQAPVLGMSTAELVQAGMGAFANGWMGGANSYLIRAVHLTTHGSSNDADTARFFLAMSILGSMGTELMAESDINISDVGYLGNILTLAGVPNDVKRGKWNWIERPDPIDQTNVTAEQLADFLDTRLSRDIRRALSIMQTVSPSFNISWARPDDHTLVENDEADALFFRGLLELLRSQVATWKAYNLEIDLNGLVTTNTDADPGNDATVESTLNDNAAFLSIDENTHLAAARGHLLNSIQYLESSIHTMQAETDPQGDDLIRVDSLDLEGDDYTRTISFLTALRNSVKLGATLIETDAGGDSTQDLILDMQRFFDVGVDYRSQGLLPAVTGDDLDKTQPCLPDPTFNGVVISPDLDTVIYDDFTCD